MLKKVPKPDIDDAALRARIIEVVEGAIDQVDTLLSDARRPTADDAREVVERVRESHVVERAGALVAAGAPLAMRFARTQMNRRNAKRAVRVMPVFVRTHPLLFGASVVGGALLGMELLTRRRGRDDAPESTERLTRKADRRAAIATGFDLEEEVARMEDEGGDAGAPLAAPRGRAGTR
jgi:hypothetical protein